MPVTPFVEESEESVHRQIDINLHGVITGTQLAIERMKPRASGHIVNIASQAGKGGLPGIATYSATKHAVVGLSEAVRGELRGSGVEMHCVMPTVVNTELTSGVGQRWVKPVEAEDVANEIVDALEVGRYDVWVPKANGALYKFLTLWPRSAREALGRLMKVDKLMTEVDHGARNAYEERVAAGEAAGPRSPRPRSRPRNAKPPRGRPHNLGGNAPAADCNPGSQRRAARNLARAARDAGGGRARARCSSTRSSRWRLSSRSASSTCRRSS